MDDSQSKLSRRRVFAGAGTVGALAAAAAVLPLAQQDEGAARQDAAAKAEKSTGYRLTEHIQRYYQTAKV
ncbi:MAG TPA: formate dehydrogenase [Methylibium sp.]|nr:formate dehydrogenase [Methylibium sp.]